MADLKTEADVVYSDFNVPGVKSSGEKEPVKADIRALWALAQTLISSVGSGMERYATVPEMTAVTDSDDGQLAQVYMNNDDPADPLNGVYQWDDGASAWVVADWYFAATTAAVQASVDLVLAASELLVDELIEDVDTPVGFFPLSTGDTEFISSTSSVIYSASAPTTIKEVGSWIWGVGSGACSLTIASGVLPNLTFVDEIALPAVTATGAMVWTDDDFGLIELAAGEHLLINSPPGGISQSTIVTPGNTFYFTYPALLTSGSAALASSPNNRLAAYVRVPQPKVVVDYDQLSPEVQDLLDGAPGGVPTVFDIYLIAGQSNAQGFLVTTGTPAIPAGYAYQYYSGSLDPIDGDPVGNSTGSSAWPAFANEYYRRTGHGVIFVPAAAGGSSLVAAADPGGLFGDWSSTGALRGAAVTALNAAKTAADAASLAWQFCGVLWSQGEADAVAIDGAVITKAQYKAEFDLLLAYLEAQTGSAFMPFLISRTGRNAGGDTIGYQQIRAAQMEATRENANVHMAFTGAVNFPARGLMSDSVHYSVAGYDEMGEAMAVVAAYRAVGSA